MKYKLLALDIDGTLLNSQSALTPRTKAAILRVREKEDVTVVLATGRRLTNTWPFVDDLALTAPVVVHNGVVVFDPQEGRTIHQRGIDMACAQDIVDKLDSLGINYVVYTGESAGERVIAPAGSWEEPEELLTYYLGERAEFVEKVALSTNPVRISLIDRVAKVDTFYESFARVYGDSMNAMLFGTERNVWRGIEIIPGDCNKGAGVAFVAESLGVQSGEVMAIGDNVNDIEMILWAGLGIAMENGSLLLKEKAQIIAPSHDHDGVARMIEEFLL